MDWSLHYPEFSDGEGKVDRAVEVADIGCGFGGLLFALAPTMPETLLLGIFSGPFPHMFGDCKLTQHRSGNPRVCNRVRGQQDTCSPRATTGFLHSGSHNQADSRHARHPDSRIDSQRLSEYIRPACQHYEVLTQFLPPPSAQQDFPLLPRSTLQGSQAQGANSLTHIELGICVCAQTRGHCVYDYRCRGSASVDEGSF